MLFRWGILCIGLVSLILALILNGIIRALLFAYTIYTSGVILPVLAGFYRNRLRVTATGALTAIIGGGSAALISKLFDIKYLDLGGLLLSGLLLFVVSVLDEADAMGQEALDEIGGYAFVAGHAGQVAFLRRIVHQVEEELHAAALGS